MAGTVLKYVLPRINTNILVRNPPAPAGELRQQAAPTLPRLACVESTDTGVVEYAGEPVTPCFPRCPDTHHVVGSSQSSIDNKLIIIIINFISIFYHYYN